MTHDFHFAIYNFPEISYFNDTAYLIMLYR